MNRKTPQPPQNDSQSGRRSEPSEGHFRQPPPEHYFKPGQSGNPKGRPKGSKNKKSIITKILNEKMSIRIAGRLRRVTVYEALIRTLLAATFKFNLKATTALLAIMRDSGYGTAESEGGGDPLALPEYEAIIANFLGRTKSISPDKAKPGGRQS
jgi:Family of unknown function (DUF5681)